MPSLAAPVGMGIKEKTSLPAFTPKVRELLIEWEILDYLLKLFF